MFLNVPGVCFYSGMVRPADQEMTATEKIVLTVSKRRRHVRPRRARWGGTRVSQEPEGVRKAWAREFIAFFLQGGLSEAG